MEKRQTQNEDVINIVYKHWNQLNEDICMLLKRGASAGLYFAGVGEAAKSSTVQVNLTHQTPTRTDVQRITGIEAVEPSTVRVSLKNSSGKKQDYESNPEELKRKTKFAMGNSKKRVDQWNRTEAKDANIDAAYLSQIEPIKQERECRHCDFRHGVVICSARGKHCYNCGRLDHYRR